jgi:hypothetical protein
MSETSMCFPNVFPTETTKIVDHTSKNLAYENTDRPEKVYVNIGLYTYIYKYREKIFHKSICHLKLLGARRMT